MKTNGSNQWRPRIRFAAVSTILTLASAGAAAPASLDFVELFGGSGRDATTGVVRDAQFVYLVGTTRSTDFPVTAGAYQSGYGGDSDPDGAGDIFVMKRDAVTREIIWATYLGGSETDFGTGIVVDDQGNSIISGWTKSANFPTSEGAPQTTLSGPSDGIIAKFDADGNLVFSSYFGGAGDDQFAAIAIQDEGGFPDFGFAVTGFSNSEDFPVTDTAGNEDTTCNCNNGATDVIAMRFGADCSVQWATFIGGSSSEVGLAVDQTVQGHVVVTGWTESSNYPKGPFDSLAGGKDAFITELEFDTARRRGSTILGGSGDDVGGGVVAIDDNNFFLAGTTTSADFLVFNEDGLGLSATSAGGNDAFLARFDDQLFVKNSGYYGGSGDEQVRFLFKDGADFLCFGGETTSTDFPVLDAIQAEYGGGPFDGFIARFQTTRNAFTQALTADPAFASYFGGSDNDTVTTGALASEGETPHDLIFGGVSASSELSSLSSMSFRPASIRSQSVLTELALLFGFSFRAAPPLVPTDFGDAPDSYGTTRANDGPQHSTILLNDTEYAGPIFGSLRDVEDDASTPLDGTGDGADEDGVILGPIVQGQNADVQIRLTVALPAMTAVTAHLRAWFDWNGNGKFDDPGERAVDETIEFGAEQVGTILDLEIPVPPDAKLGTSYARFRVTSSSILEQVGAQGVAPDGEVEDYAILIQKPTPDISVSPPQLNFGGVPLGESAQKQWSVSNNGTGPLDIGSFETVGADPDAFDIDATFPTTIMPQERLDFTATFTPASLGENNVTFLFNSNDPDTPQIGLQMTGSGLPASLQPDIAPSTDQINFGQAYAVSVPGVVAGDYNNNGEIDEADYKLFQLNNVGNATLRIDAAQISGADRSDFSLWKAQFGVGSASAGKDEFGNLVLAVEGEKGFSKSAVNLGGVVFEPIGGDFSATIEPGEGLTLAVNFAPASPGLKEATVTIDSNDTDEPRVNLTLTGEGVEKLLDFGDVPDSTDTPAYPTLQAHDGARHVIPPGGAKLFLGLVPPDAEADGQPSATALDDDTVGTPDDEEGVILPVAFESDRIGVSLPVSVTGEDGFLSAWIDWDKDDAFENNEERVVSNQAVQDGLNLFFIEVPELGVDLQETYARFRFSTQQNLEPTGEASDGEVEDYVVNLAPSVDYGDAPKSYGTTYVDFGARHRILPGENPLRLGSFVRPERDAEAEGNGFNDDDAGEEPEEDGVTLPAQFQAGVTGTVSIAVNGVTDAAVLQAWFDWNQNRKFDENELTINHNLIAPPGVIAESVTPPATARVGQTWARFRLSSAGSPGPTGMALDGEVEDYQITVAAPDAPDIAADETLLDYDTIVVGTMAPVQTVIISNEGLRNLTVSKLEISGANAGDFMIDADTAPEIPKTLAPDDEISVDVIFKPSAAGARSAVLTITSNDPDEPTVTVELIGIGKAPTPDLAVSITRQRIRFLSLDGQPREPLLETTVVVENKGTAAATSPTLTINRMGLLTAFTSNGTDCQSSEETGEQTCALPTIQPGQSVTVQYTDFISPLDMSHVTKFEATATVASDENPGNNGASKSYPFVRLKIFVSPENPNEICVTFQAIPLYDFTVVTADFVRGPYTELTTIQGEDIGIKKVTVPRNQAKRFITLRVTPATI